jgi:hypothetical protein
MLFLVVRPEYRAFPSSKEEARGGAGLEIESVKPLPCHVSLPDRRAAIMAAEVRRSALKAWASPAEQIWEWRISTRFRGSAAMLLNVPYCQDSGHHAALDRAAQINPSGPFEPWSHRQHATLNQQRGGRKRANGAKIESCNTTLG